MPLYSDRYALYYYALMTLLCSALGLLNHERFTLLSASFSLYDGNLLYNVFSLQAFNESLTFATVDSLMNNANLTDSCQAHLPVQCASNIEFIRQMWH